MNPLKATEARELIKQLNRMDLDQADYCHIKEVVNRLFVGIEVRGITPHRESRLYRGVVYCEKPLDVTQIGPPPSSTVVDFQRCNPPNKPMFYCSPDPASVFYELNVKAGDRLYLTKWSVLQDFVILQIAPKAEGIARDHLGDMVATFFETKFAQPIHATYSSQYKITSAIAERLSQGNVVGRDDLTMGALSYPSVSHPARSENIAIQPVIVDSCLRLDYAEEMEIKEVRGKKIDYSRTDFCSHFPNGKIEWEGQILHWTVPPSSRITLTVEADGWIARDETGQIVNPG